MVDLKNIILSNLFIAFEGDRDVNALIQGLMNALPVGHATEYSMWRCEERIVKKKGGCHVLVCIKYHVKCLELYCSTMVLH